ncbi:uncharacterized protein [Manis javanica]|uniref:uncharacterized protein n=1 Tax=Manis javanica TaxID=9974 RepID=UPI003C6DB73C
MARPRRCPFLPGRGNLAPPGTGGCNRLPTPRFHPLLCFPTAVPVFIASRAPERPRRPLRSPAAPGRGQKGQPGTGPNLAKRGGCRGCPAPVEHGSTEGEKKRMCLSASDPKLGTGSAGSGDRPQRGQGWEGHPGRDPAEEGWVGCGAVRSSSCRAIRLSAMCPCSPARCESRQWEAQCHHRSAGSGRKTERALGRPAPSRGRATPPSPPSRPSCHCARASALHGLGSWARGSPFLSEGVRGGLGLARKETC